MNILLICPDFEFLPLKLKETLSLVRKKFQRETSLWPPWIFQSIWDSFYGKSADVSNAANATNRFFFFFRQNWNDLVYRSQRNGNKSLVPSAVTLSRNTWALKQTVRFYTTGSIKRDRQAGKTKNFTDQKLHSINPKGRIQNRQQKKREVTRN